MIFVIVVDVLARVRLRRVGAPLALAVRRLEPRHDLRQLLGLLRIGRRREHQRHLQQVQLPALVGRHLDACRTCVASFANCAPASLAAWFARAAIASVSSVMKVCCTQPAWPCWMPSFSVVSLAVSRKAFASAAVGADEEDGVCAQPNASAQTPAIARRVLHPASLTRPDVHVASEEVVRDRTCVLSSRSRAIVRPVAAAVAASSASSTAR